MITSLDNYLLNIFYWLLLVSKKIKFVNRTFRLPQMEIEKKKKKIASKLSVAQHTSAECRSVLKDRIPKVITSGIP